MLKGFQSGLYRKIDDLVDLNGAGWSKIKPLLDILTYLGKYYVPASAISDGGVLVYNRNTVSEYNLEDPRELFRRGEWTWDKMLEMIKAFSDPDDKEGGKFGRYGVDGWNSCNVMHTTCGKPFVSYENGKLVSNLNHPVIERVMNFQNTCYQANVIFPKLENDDQPNFSRVASGMTLFIDSSTSDFRAFTSGAYAMGEDASYVP